MRVESPPGRVPESQAIYSPGALTPEDAVATVFPRTIAEGLHDYQLLGLLAQSHGQTVLTPTGGLDGWVEHRYRLGCEGAPQGTSEDVRTAWLAAYNLQVRQLAMNRLGQVAPAMLKFYKDCVGRLAESETAQKLDILRTISPTAKVDAFCQTVAVMSMPFEQLLYVLGLSLDSQLPPPAGQVLDHLTAEFRSCLDALKGRGQAVFKKEVLSLTLNLLGERFSPKWLDLRSECRTPEEALNWVEHQRKLLEGPPAQPKVPRAGPEAAAARFKKLHCLEDLEVEALLNVLALTYGNHGEPAGDRFEQIRVGYLKGFEEAKAVAHPLALVGWLTRYAEAVRENALDCMKRRSVACAVGLDKARKAGNVPAWIDEQRARALPVAPKGAGGGNSSNVSRAAGDAGRQPKVASARSPAAEHRLTALRDSLSRAVPLVAIDMGNLEADASLALSALCWCVDREPLLAALHQLEKWIRFSGTKLDVDKIGEDGRPPLFLAIANRNIRMVEYLLKHGADICIRPGNSQTSLTAVISAFQNGRVFKHDAKCVAIYKLLLKHDGKVSKGAGMKGLLDSLPIDLASRPDFMERHSFGIKLMQAMTPADFNATSSAGVTPLVTYVNARDSEPSGVKLLIELGADPNFKSAKGTTALAVAVFFEDEACAQALLEAGARPDIADDDLCNAWHHAAGVDSDRICMLLMKFGSPEANGRAMEFRDSKGLTPLLRAVSTDSLTVVSWMVKNGADLGVADLAGCTAWLHAARSKSFHLLLPIVALSGSTGGIDKKNGQGETPLSVAKARSDNTGAMWLEWLGARSDETTTGRNERARMLEKMFIVKFENIAQALVRENQKELDKLAANCAAQASRQRDAKAYGGDAGNAYFTAYRDRVAIPALAHFFAYIRERMIDEERDDPEMAAPLALSVLHATLAKMGEMRAHIARATFSNTPERFGARLFGEYLTDPVYNYLAWDRYVGQQVRGLLKFARDSIAGEKTWGNLILELEKLGCETTEPIAPDIDEDAWSFAFTIPGGPLAGDFNVEVDVANYEPETTFDEKSEIGRDAFDDAGRFALQLTTNCWHESVSAHRLGAMANALATAIKWSGPDITALKGSFHDILRNASKCSIFSGGQASIVEFILAALSKQQGLALSWADDWAPGSRERMSPDIRSLSGFDEEVFRREFTQAIVLTGEKAGLGGASFKVQ